MSAREDIAFICERFFIQEGAMHRPHDLADAILAWVNSLDLRDRIRSAVRTAEHDHYNASFASRPGLPDERECADTITDAVLAVLAEVGLVTE